MKISSCKQGPFKERPHYTLEEIEDICLDNLKAVDLLPLIPGPIRIERFIEKRFKISPIYGDLSDGVLGYSKFGPAGVEEIVVSRSLEAEGSLVAERRISTTLAHEAGHCLLQAHLFALESDFRTLFGDGLDKIEPKILCRNGSISGVKHAKSTIYDGRWWEYQANRGIGALLIPRPLLIESLKSFLLPQGILLLDGLDESRRSEAIVSIAETFGVNPIVAKIRIDDVFPLAHAAQLTL